MKWIMKVLSLIEPYATLIKEKKKMIETRSWKTNYRGELYIHASATAIPKDWKNQEVMKFVDVSKLSYGYILCKCNLVDCQYMTKEYVEHMKKEHPMEYLCGVYKEGRYAWILDSITPLEHPIKAKGSLNLWNYYNEQEIMELMEQIDYGWVDEHKKKHVLVDDLFSSHYRLQSPQEILKSKVGVCWDQVELERFYFKGNDWNIKTYFIVFYDGDRCPTHTFLTYEKDHKFYWFEHSWEKYKGIHEYSKETELLCDVKNKFIESELNNTYEKENLKLYEYKKPKAHLSVLEFYQHCEKGIVR